MRSHGNKYRCHWTRHDYITQMLDFAMKNQWVRYANVWNFISEHNSSIWHPWLYYKHTWICNDNTLKNHHKHMKLSLASKYSMWKNAHTHNTGQSCEHQFKVCLNIMDVIRKYLDNRCTTIQTLCELMENDWKLNPEYKKQYNIHIKSMIII